MIFIFSFSMLIWFCLYIYYITLFCSYINKVTHYNQEYRRMGTFISTISEDNSLKTNMNSVWSEPLQKIKEYHGMFKYVCDSFVIHQQQYKQIFGSADKAKIWDPQCVGKIDALQIFCGLIIFAKQASFKRKLSFLFCIFDFNQIKSLSFIDVEVMILNICNSVYKIMKKNGKVNENQIAEWLANYLNKKQRVKITQLYYFCLKNPVFQAFFKYINDSLEEQIILFTEQQKLTQSQLIDPSQFQKISKSHRHSINRVSTKQKQQIAENIEWHRQLMDKIVKVQQNQYRKPKNQSNNPCQNNYGCSISWVYGINTSGFSKPFIPLKKIGGCIVYRSSSMAIIYNLELNEQYIMEGHREQVNCMAYSQKNEILATVQACQFPCINLWKPLNLGNRQRTSQKFIKYGSINTNHNKGVKLIQFIARQTLLATVGARYDSPIIIYDYIKQEVEHQIILKQNISRIFNPLILIERSEVNSNISDTFFAISQKDNTIYEIILRNHSSKSKSSNSSQQIKLHTYLQLQNANEITSAISCYLNISNPYLRSYKDKSIGTVILTGHESGSVCMLSNNAAYSQEQVISELMGPVVCMQMTSNILAVAAGTYVYVYGLDVLSSKASPILACNLKNQEENVQLMSYNFKYFDFVTNFILAMTDQGEFVKIQTQTIFKNPSAQHFKTINASLANDKSNNKTMIAEQLKVSRVSKLIKFQGKYNFFCLLDWKQNHQLIFFATNDNKVLAIDSVTHEVHDLWEINTSEIIVAIDAVYSAEGACYIVCACKSGKLYIRICVDWKQAPKFYDCGSQIIDAKISKDCSYLLVATASNYLLFFAQVNSNFTSPRKLLFQYETPCSINFLDNYKFFIVVTSAKNSYLIEIPQLKHKKLHKQTQKISISKVYVKYPYCSNKKQVSYSIGCLGGVMKFSLLAMRQKDIYFFNNHDALQRGNYTILDTHKCPISQIAVNQLQSKFYTLGKTDNTLVEWEAFETKYKKKKILSLSEKSQSQNAEYENQIYFEDMQQFCKSKGSGNQFQMCSSIVNRNKNQTYFFKGTKLQKINQIIQKYYQSFTNQTKKKLAKLKKTTSPSRKSPKKQQQFCSEVDVIKQVAQIKQMQELTSEDWDCFRKRPPSLSISAEQVYGFQTYHKQSISYNNEGTQIMGFSSRFIIRMNIKTKKQVIYEPTNKKISYLLRSQIDNEILYCVVEERPMIYLLYKEALKTTHHRGIIHMAVHKQFVLSYGIAENAGYSINLHNYETGELLHTAFTDIKVCEFILVSQKLAVSLNEVRIWESLYPSQIITIASAGCLLPNNKDILLGLHDGMFAILSDRGVFRIGNQAHEKAIDVVKIKPDRNGNSDNFEIISIGRDEKIKIWTNCFQTKMMISFRHRSNLVFIGQSNKQLQIPEIIVVKSIDIYKNKILMALHSGHIVEVEIQTIKKIEQKASEDQTNKFDNHTSLNMVSLSEKSVSHVSFSNNEENQNSLTSEEFQLGQLTYKWTNIYQLHSAKTKRTMNRRTFFSVNSVYPLIASSACDYQILIRDFQTNQIVCKRYFQKQIIQCIKFSPKGNLLAIGLDSGLINFYEVKVIKDQNDKIQNVVLKSYQKFTPKGRQQSQSEPANFKHMPNSQQSSKCSYSIINMQFSECSTFFAVSYVYESQQKGLQSSISIYKTRQSTSMGSNQNGGDQDYKEKKSVPRILVNENQIQYYFQADTIDITSSTQPNITINNHPSKFIKSAYFIAFCNEVSDVYKNYNTSSNIEKSNILSSNKNLTKSTTKRQQLKIKSQKLQTYLILYEQYIDGNKVRINNDNKMKIKIYNIEDKAIFTQEQNINFLKIKFAPFVYGRMLRYNDYYIRGTVSGMNSYKNENNYEEMCNNMSVNGYGQSGYINGNCTNAKNQQQIKIGYGEEKMDSQLTISQMITIGDNLVYGDTTGKLHLVKLNSLLLSSQEGSSCGQASQKLHNKSSKNIYTINNIQRANMNLSKTYCSHTSFINHMEVSADYQYLFVSGSTDECVVKYKLTLETDHQDLDSICYPFHFKDIHDEYLTKNKFYEFLNNIDPIRDQISDIMLDVEHDKRPDQRKTNKTNQGTQLQPLRIYGRRAFDKRNNLFQDGRGNLVYSLGPNIIIQNPFDPLKQTYIPADPNAYSNSPQISCLNMSGRHLMVATEQQNSRIFVWDIFTMTCLSQMRLKNFSVVYHLVQSSSRKMALLYGINNLYEASMQLIDWQEQRVLGSVSLMYTGCWKIKDICQIHEKDDGLQFVSCGVQHLCYWQYVADTLVCSSFALDSLIFKDVTFMTVKCLQDLVIAGCESGNIFVFKGFKLVSYMKLHTGPIRAIAVEGSLVFSGGMDTRVCVSTISVDDMDRYTIKMAEEHTIKNKTMMERRSSQNNKESKMKKSSSNSMQSSQPQLILAEQDIQSLVLVRSSSSKNISRVFIGTRSGNILLLKRELSAEVNTSHKNSTGKNNNLSIQQSNKRISRNNSLISSTQKIALSNGQVEPVMWSHDNDTIASVCFDQLKPDLFYILTFSGMLEIWSLKTLKRLYVYKLAQQANKIFCFNQYIIICCERSIRTVKVDIQDNRICYIKEMSKEYQGIITDCCLSKICNKIDGSDSSKNKEQSSQKQSNFNSKSSMELSSRKTGSAYLVVGLKKSQFNEIIINEISNQIEEKFVVVNLKYQIQFMDFSRDCRYLLFKDSFEELGMVNLQNFKRINTIFVEMGIEWESEGVRISPYGQKIYCSYSRQNKITVLRRISDKEIIIGDQMGTLRTFQYPCSDQKIGELHTHCYATHMNFIKNIQIHPSQPYAITTAVYDRSLILWKIIRPEGSQNSTA